MSVSLYISPLRNTKNLELSILQFGDAQLQAGWCCTSPDVFCNRLYLIESGDAVLHANGRKISLQPAMAYLVPAGNMVSFTCRSNVKKLYFHFNLFRCGRNDLFYGLHDVLEIPFPLERIESLRAHGSGNSIHDSMMVKQQLYQLLTDIQNKYGISQEPVPFYSALTMDAITYIQQNLSARLTLDILADHCRVSSSLLSKEFCKEVGIPLGKYIDNQLLITAQWQLLYTNSSINEISHMLGYSDPSYFSRRFKQLCGMSPMQCRHRHS